MSGDNDYKVTLFPDGSIKTKPTTKEYEEGWERIFNKESILLESLETHDWVPGHGWILKELRKDK